MSKKEKIALSLGLVVLVLIFISSSMTYQQQNIQSDLQPFWPPFTRFLNSFSFVYAGEKHSLALDGYAGYLEFILRKLAHFASYFLMGAFFYYGLRRLIKHNFFPALIIWLAMTGLAAFDEYHQAITGGRTPSVHDVMLDSFGAVVGILLVGLIIFVVWRHHERKKLAEN
ncbi:integral membrane protein [Amylolactobacillus amylotrophicus DSM 20534]|uniref:Integral membrane protein n=1 Tax=Amylolactobacillus amylotrophicus DSM 20534 TaxID=1423722 RepID=A0A0R1H4N6_9LACO|nr:MULTISPECIES: VanZ family protein [Amylolactobacillus]KRK38737.1 integral membrane protein [Amylolactobacillus amylotrophicus DSM 20534]GED79957.1 membrane protein [Amylolactobacillus amylophilus]